MYPQDFPADRLLNNLSSYNYAPFVPNLNLPDNYNNLLPDIVTATINEIIANNRKTPIRTYCFNRLSDNNFQNQDFVGLVELISNLIILNVEASRMDINSAANSAIKDGCTYHASITAKSNPNLHQYINQEAEQAIMANLREYEERLSMIDRFMSGNMNRNQQSINNYSNTFVNNGFNSGSNSFSNNRNMPSNNGFANQSNRFPNNRSNSTGNGYQMFNTNKDVKVDSRFDTNQGKKLDFRTIQNNTSVSTNVQHDKGVKMCQGKTLEGKDMDGNTFFGIDLDISSILKKKEITLNNLTESVDEENSLLFLTGTTLEDVLLNTKIKHIQIKDKNSNIQTFRSYGIVCEPIINNNKISKEIGDILGYSEKVVAGVDLVSVSIKLRHLLDKTKNDVTVDKKYLIDLIKTISYINNFLTDSINEFLYESLSDIGSIDSYMDDIADLKNMLSVKKKEVSQAWESFCNNVVSSLTYKLEDEIYKDIIDNVYMEKDEKDTILLTKIITITSLDITYIQFGCSIDKNVSLTVDATKTPNVFEVIDGIFSMKEDECNSLDDYIVLNDGVYLKIYKDYVNNCYKLKRIK